MVRDTYTALEESVGMHYTMYAVILFIIPILIKHIRII